VPQALDRLPHGLVGQPPRGQFLLEGDIRQQIQGPGAPGLAEAPRGLVEDALERVGLRLIKYGLGVLGAALLFAQAVRAFLREGVDRVVDGPDGAPDVRGDPRRSVALGAGQEDLGAAERERPAAPKSCLERPTLGVGQLPNEQW
jgi:hypothetical protein